MIKLTWSQAAAWRARRHHLDQRAPAGSLLAVASRLCGLHAQVLSCAEPTWRHEIKRSAVEVVVEPFNKTPTWVRRLSRTGSRTAGGFLRSRIEF